MHKKISVCKYVYVDNFQQREFRIIINYAMITIAERCRFNRTVDRLGDHRPTGQLTGRRWYLPWYARSTIAASVFEPTGKGVRRIRPQLNRPVYERRLGPVK